MHVLLVTYDLNRPGQNHDSLLTAIKGFPGWAKLSESSYAIATTSAANEVHEELSVHLDANDTLYVVILTAPYSGQGPPDVNDWLAQNLL